MSEHKTSQLSVKTGTPYDILIGCGLLPSLPQHLDELKMGKKYLLVTHEVLSTYASQLQNALNEHGYKGTILYLPAGEETKSYEYLNQIYDKLIDERLDRGSFMIAVGGGVIGDIVGYAAATYLRGIDFVQVPTTLLAMVDSSVGGKTAIDHPKGKNLIGAFHQPRLVLADLDVLGTLPERDYVSAIAEIIKYGVIYDKGMFHYLETNMEKLLARDEEVLRYCVTRSCQIKGHVVEQDEKESSLRAILNYGHTIGHAIEACAGYKLSHGECVAIGMVGAARLAVESGIFTEEGYNRIFKLILKAGLPVDVLNMGLNVEQIKDVIFNDKKVVGGNLKFVLPKEIGTVMIEKVDFDKVIPTLVALGIKASEKVK